MAVAAATTATGARPGRAGRRPPLAWIGTVPFLGYVGVFLLLPTGIVIWNAFRTTSGGLDLTSLTLLGTVLAYCVASGNPDGAVRRLYLAGSGVLAQFGGVTLAFAFNAAIGPTSGFLFHASWYYNFPWGIDLIYLYFSIPLMVLVFLPAIDGLKVQWREASESLGGSAWQYWRHVGGPLLAPAFCGATLLLFANSLSAYATIQAWENQISYTVPQQIYVAISSEVGLSNANYSSVLALGMVIMVAIIMAAYALLQRRAA